MDRPGTIARVKVVGSDYASLLEQAQKHFDNLFQGPVWDIIGAEIQPDQVDEGFEGVNILTWQGMFYAMPHTTGD